MSSSCGKGCAGSGRHYKVPRERLDKVRKRLDFSEVSSEGSSQVTPPSPVRYAQFKKVAERHSPHNVRKPMYTSAELASVPDSFLDLFRSRLGPPPSPPPPPQPPKRASPSPKTESEIEIPGSFLEFCQRRLAARAARRPQSPSPPPSPCSYQSPTPPPARCSYESPTPPPSPCSYQSPSPPPSPCSYQSSSGSPFRVHYGPSYGADRFDASGRQTGMIFSPKFTSTRREASPTRARSPGRSQLPPEFGYGNYRYPTRPTTSPAVGLPSKYYSPCSPSPPTPPCARPKQTYADSTVSSGDLLSMSPSPQRQSRSTSRRSHSRSINGSPGHPIARSTPVEMDYLRVPGANVENISSPCRASVRPTESNLSVRRRGPCETIDTDQLQAESGKSGCPACPTLGVTPMQSAVSITQSEHSSFLNKQNISKSIEHELLAREAQERSQLEADLLRWQQARRKLVINTANMGS